MLAARRCSLFTWTVAAWALVRATPPHGGDGGANRFDPPESAPDCRRDARVLLDAAWTTQDISRACAGATSPVRAAAAKQFQDAWLLPPAQVLALVWNVTAPADAAALQACVHGAFAAGSCLAPCAFGSGETCTFVRHPGGTCPAICSAAVAQSDLFYPGGTFCARMERWRLAYLPNGRRDGDQGLDCFNAHVGLEWLVSYATGAPCAAPEFETLWPDWCGLFGPPTVERRRWRLRASGATRLPTRTSTDTGTGTHAHTGTLTPCSPAWVAHVVQTCSP